MSSRNLTVEAGGPLRGEIMVPGDKSITQRAFILAALAEGTSEIINASTALDCRSTLRALAGLGAAVSRRREGLVILGRGSRGLAEPSAPLSFGNSGTGLRLTAGALASHPVYAVLDGDGSLRRRPMGRIIAPLRRMGARVWGRDGDRFPPLALKGGGLKGMDYPSPVASAQVKSAVLLAAIGAEGRTVFSEPERSRDHTERMFPSFGLELRVGPREVSCSGPQNPRAARIIVPGDVSSAAFWVVAALIVPGSAVVIREVGLNATRRGYLEILRRMGGKVIWTVEDDLQGEPVGRIEAAYSRLSGTAIGEDEIPSAIDELPILTVAAAAARGVTVISGAGELRVKESDRIRAMASQLSAMGADARETSDGLVIEGGRPLRGSVLDSFGDHRVAMSLAVASLTARGRAVIRDTRNIDTSYPGFEATLSRLTSRHPKGRPVAPSHQKKPKGRP